MVDSEPEPLCGQEEFTELVADMVKSSAPRLFAIVQEYGERVDARISAWGLDFDDKIEILDVDGRLRMSLMSTDRALWMFSRHPDVSAEVVWVA
ncbi:hypothetical protein ABZU76_05655 [Amycolatopsis sp. NPDC005232]|uniref:hypothetical protein n=1 Tax=Amycolatopsis sp. NPDC005232 TaxID=3157027 RepID=UPI0033BC7F5D